MTVLSRPAGPGGNGGLGGPAGTGAPRMTPAIVTGRVSRLRRGGQNGRGGGPRILLVRARPEWTGPADLDVGGRPVRVVPCVSMLAVLEEITRWARDPVEDGWLFLLTDADEETLGDSVLAQVHRQRVDIIEPWLAVLEDFGAIEADSRLRAPEFRWIAQALLEARPATGWPRRPGRQLSRQDALAELAAVRLGLPELGLGAADLDISTLLRWTTTPGATDALSRLGAEERAGLTAYLAERTGRPGQALFTLIAAGNGERALALGLVCDCLWPRRDRGRASGLDPTRGRDGDPAGWPARAGEDSATIAAIERAKVRVERYFGDVRLDDTVMRAFADAVREVIVTELASTRPGGGRVGLDPGGGAVATLHPEDGLLAVLDAAARVLADLDAPSAGAASDVLRTGFDHRLAAVADAVRNFVASAESGVVRALLARTARDVATAVGSLRGHLLAGFDRPEVERAVMAARLVGWLAAQPTGSLSVAPTASGQAPAAWWTSGPTTLDEALDTYLDDGAWADIALSHLAVGTPAPAVGTAYTDLYRVASRRRRALDTAFAQLLAQWTVTGRSAGTLAPGGALVGQRGPLCVEDVLDRVVAPVLTSRNGRALLVVLDGMSAAVAAQLAAELRRERWEECDPLGAAGSGTADPARRRAALAVLPTVTATSRTSLLAGRLTDGDKATEKAEFEGHRRWRRRAVRLFHHSDLAGEPGVALDGELADVLTSDTPLVAVVINTIDETLDKGRQRDDGGWSLTDVRRLRAVLGYARTAGRVLILTSDHGHVVDHGSQSLAAADAVTARHRTPGQNTPGQGAGLRDGEVELAGPRVLAPGGRIVALWDQGLRYRSRKGGYHGGASPAETTVPVLAFLPFPLSATSADQDLPPGWRPLPDQRPHWWSLEATDLLGSLGGGDTVLVGQRSSAFAAGSAPAATSAEGTMLVPRKRRRTVEEQVGPALFDLPEAPSRAPAQAGSTAEGSSGAGREGEAPDPVDVLVAGLLASELFQSQLAGLARQVPVEKVEAAVRALVGANGTLATSVVAERARERPVRAAGFAVTLQRLFNIDNYPVLERIDDGHTLRLNVQLLRDQFGLKA
ncbi:BREX-2 system phosphatase PglZ [Frankia sp. Cpl3]|nr:BREX-2 system phosphatase PglZ [Frankia sp. Cpl3]